MSFPPPTQKQARVLWFAVTGLAIAAMLALGVVLIWALGRVLEILSPVIWPIAFAAVVACLLDPVVDWMESHKVPRTRAVACVFVLALTVVVGVAGSVVPQALVEAKQLVLRVPDYASRIQTRLEEWANHPPHWIRQYLEPRAPTVPPVEPSTNGVPAVGSTTNAVPVESNPASGTLFGSLDQNTLRSASSWLAKGLPALGSWLFGRTRALASVFGLLAGMVLVPIYAVLFSEGKARHLDPLARLPPDDRFRFQNRVHFRAERHQ